MSERWAVAMSGGVDSSVAAAVLARQGIDVIGITMDLGVDDPAVSPSSARSRPCCGIPDAEDARAVARRLGIRHYTFNYRQDFQREVTQPFVAEYLAGRTPIPCIACNRVLKFDLLRRRALGLGARGIATGHYARIADQGDGRLGLYRARDREKDQTYFLFDLPGAALAELRFPIGEMQKSEVRELARSLQLATADKPESQGICFIPDGDVKSALRRLSPDVPDQPGEIRDRQGRRLGSHRGAVGYTLGQRKGLGLADGPWHVAEVRPSENLLIVERAPALERHELTVSAVTWLDGEPPAEDVRVQVRHRGESIVAALEATGESTLRIRLEKPVWAPAAGQAAVVYDPSDQRLLGGGWIAGSA